MEFTSYGLEVYSSEVDDRGIDFIVKDKHGRFCEIQVKSLRGKGYTFVQKSKFSLENENLYLTLLIFEQGKMPDLFLIPTAAWKTPNEVFVDKNYDKPGQTSKPEYGINVSPRNYSILKQYYFSDRIEPFV
jgi:hypothetical protein